MNIKPNYFKKILIPIFTSMLLIACSVEQKPISDSAQNIPGEVDTPIENDPPMIMNPGDIVLPPADYVEQQPQSPIILMPKPKPSLSKKQLFSGALDSHNRIRSKHGLKPLKWSDKLAAYSQEWANHLGAGNSCKMYHRSGSPPFGENLYISSAVVWSAEGREVSRERNSVTIKDVVKVWTDEERWYNYNTNSCQLGKKCGHYTQVVWRDTTEVGCAVKFCGDKSQNWVCSYNPPGNYTGVRPY